MGYTPHVNIYLFEKKTGYLLVKMRCAELPTIYNFNQAIWARKYKSFATGLATAAAVYQDSPALVRGTWQTFTTAATHYTTDGNRQPLIRQAEYATSTTAAQNPMNSKVSNMTAFHASGAGIAGPQAGVRLRGDKGMKSAFADRCLRYPPPPWPTDAAFSF